MLKILLSCFVLLITFHSINSAVTCSNICNGGTKQCDTGQNIVVVAQIFNGVTSRFYPYCVAIDRVHELRINGSFSFVTTTPAVPANAYLKLWIQTTETAATESFKGFIFDSASTLAAQNQMVAPYFSAFINLNNGYFNLAGNITNNVNYETVCTGSACDLDYSKGCLAATHCSAPPSTLADKDVKIMLGFVGTDKSARFFTSANLLPHKYRFYSFSNVYNDVINIVKP